MTDFFDQEQQSSQLRAVPDLAEPSVEIDLTAEPYSVPAVEQLLEQAIEEVAGAKTSPMSTMAKINRDEILDLLEDARDHLPDELRRARWLLKEKEEFLAHAERERDEIIDQSRREVAKMVDRQAIVRAAEAKARQIVEEARSDARVMQRQMEDFCDQKLATFEVLLDRTSRTIHQGRQKLMGAASAQEELAGHASHEDDFEIDVDT